MCENIIELAMSDDLGQMEANSKRLAIGLVLAPRETMTLDLVIQGPLLQLINHSSPCSLFLR